MRSFQIPASCAPGSFSLLRNSRTLPWLLAALLLLPVAISARGEQADPAETVEREVRYVELQPAFVTNYGFADSGRMKYVKTNIAVRVSSHKAEMATRYHLPALRNALILLLSQQDEAAVSSGSGRELMRAQALRELNGILEYEEGQPLIDDLLFTNFVVQR
jgi:flagellar protein FliL